MPKGTNGYTALAKNLGMIKGNISFRNSSKKSGLSFEKQSIEWDKMISSLKSNPK